MDFNRDGHTAILSRRFWLALCLQTLLTDLSLTLRHMSVMDANDSDPSTRSCIRRETLVFLINARTSLAISLLF